MAETRTEIIQDMFYSFNRDPHSASGLVESFCKKAFHMDPIYMRKAVNELIATHQYLPKYRDVEIQYGKTIPKYTDQEIEKCLDCRETGLVHTIFKKTENGKREIYGLEQSPSGMYYTFIIGSCKCLNGNVYRQAHPSVDMPSWISNLAQQKGTDCLTVIEKMHAYCNKKAREKKEKK